MMLEKSEVKNYYDKCGKKQDWQSFYENAAIETLIKNSDFQNAENIFEFGCGTGKFAEDLLEKHLNKQCKYLGTDLSDTMCEIASKRLEQFKFRAKIELVDGSTKLRFPENSFDRFVSNYVLDILSNQDIRQIFSEARRILKKNGLLSVASLACGKGFISKPISDLWSFIQKRKPKLVGGCRPLSLLEFVGREVWEIKHHQKTSSFGITSEILVLTKA